MTGDPMLLMLGDHIYRSTHEQGTSCVRQLVWRPGLSSVGGGGAPRGPRMYGIPHVCSSVDSCLRVAGFLVHTQVQQLLSSYDGGSIMAPTHVHTVKERVAGEPQPKRRG